jgi:23S rRNA (cytosine1962-C5)-methyltransferase
MSASAPVVHLRADRERLARSGHPWIFSGAIARIEGEAPSPVARVRTAAGQDLGWGFFDPQSRIPVRLLRSRAEAIDGEFFRARIATAQRLRASLVPAGTTGYRLLNAEADGVPGWTVDRFGDVLVSQITSSGLESLRELAYAALLEAFPSCALVQRNELSARRLEGLPLTDEVIQGEIGAEAPFQEHGLTLFAELAGGQKTGFYCDQRENRRLAERLASGRRVLDLFAHTGAFGLYCLRGGAQHVTAIESSPRLAEIASRQLTANALDASQLEWVKADVGTDLRHRRERYDLVVCDPPPLVPRRSDAERGARAYKDLNRLALSRVAAGGYFLTFTCSSGVDAKLFRQILFAAAEEAKVELSLLAPLAASPDHPVDVFHPEGEYLKGWFAYVR